MIRRNFGLSMLVLFLIGSLAGPCGSGAGGGEQTTTGEFVPTTTDKPAETIGAGSRTSRMTVVNAVRRRPVARRGPWGPLGRKTRAHRAPLEAVEEVPLTPLEAVEEVPLTPLEQAQSDAAEWMQQAMQAGALAMDFAAQLLDAEWLAEQVALDLVTMTLGEDGLYLLEWDDGYWVQAESIWEAVRIARNEAEDEEAV